MAPEKPVNKEAFVYRWRHQGGMWYIGYHKGTPDDGYICSSNTVKPLIQESPEEWTRKILRYGTRQEMVKLEHKILKHLNATHNTKSLNRSMGLPTMSIRAGRPGSKQKMSWNKFLQELEQQLGYSYQVSLAIDYSRAMLEKDTKLIEKYNKMFLRNFGFIPTHPYQITGLEFKKQ
jgi:hypothetical protein